MDPVLTMHLINMVVYTVVGVLLMFGGYKLFDVLTPKIDYSKELVDNKNVAVGMMVGAIILSVAAIIVAVIVS